MARLPRYVLPPSGYYHVTTRGVDWTWIYRDDEDRRHFLRLLGSSSAATAGTSTPSA